VHAHKSRHECVLLPFEALIRAHDRLEPERGQAIDASLASLGFAWRRFSGAARAARHHRA
jgi:hypothetical protein